MHFVAHICSVTFQLQSAPGTMEVHGAPCVVFCMSSVLEPQLRRAEAIAQGGKASRSSVRAVDRLQCELLDRNLSKTWVCAWSAFSTARCITRACSASQVRHHRSMDEPEVSELRASYSDRLA